MEDSQRTPVGPGDRYGNLLIERELGTGAFATVFLARDVVVGRHVALKVLKGEVAADSRERERMLREVRLVGQLTSPHIVTLFHLYDLGKRGAMFEMEYVDGETLAEALASRGKPPIAETIRIMTAVCHALAEAHSHEVIHRDMKPGNVLLGKDGTIKLADFGLGRQLGEASLSGSGEGHILGTPLYLAPEIVTGGRASFVSDIWSVGVLLYQMLTGTLPFDASNMPTLFRKIEGEDPAPLPDAVLAPMREIVTRCLSKPKDDRPQAVTDVLDALVHLGGS